MNFSFDYFRNLKDPDFTLCNPDKRKIAILETRYAHLTFDYVNSLNGILSTNASTSFVWTNADGHT